MHALHFFPPPLALSLSPILFITTCTHKHTYILVELKADQQHVSLSFCISSLSITDCDRIIS